MKKKSKKEAIPTDAEIREIALTKEEPQFVEKSKGFAVGDEVTLKGLPFIYKIEELDVQVARLSHRGTSRGWFPLKDLKKVKE